MNIVVLMAGEGSRFKEIGYPLPKPFIEVGDKHILEWTTKSLPFIKHYGKSKIDIPYNLTFAIRTEHEDQFQIISRLKKIYGEDINIKIFDKLTQGNLETAYLTCQDLDQTKEVLILDSDNAYDGSNFLNFLNMFKNKYEDFATICHFQPLDNSHKWCFAIKQGNKVKDLLEKDERAISLGGQPMVGTFYYNKTSLFTEVSEFILGQNKKIRGEFYMSQSIQCLIDNGINVFGCEVADVKPLGTPEDIVKIRDNEYESMY